MKNQPIPISNSAHKKGVQSVGSNQISGVGKSAVNIQGAQPVQQLRQSSMTPDRSSNQQFLAQNNQSIQLANQKHLQQMISGNGGQYGDKQGQKMHSNSATRGQLYKKQQNALDQNMRESRERQSSASRGQHLLAQQAQSLQNPNISTKQHKLQPDGLPPAQTEVHNSIEDIVTAQQNVFGKGGQFNQSQALIGSSRKGQKIQIHMKNNRFHNRKASGPAALNHNAQSLNQQKQQLLIQQQISQERISNYESAQNMQNHQFVEQYNNSQMAVSNQMINNHPSKTPQLPRQGQSGTKQNRPGSKSLPRKEKSVGQFGRTFFHPPSGDNNFNTSGTALIDPNMQYLPNKFNTTAASGNMSQAHMGGNHGHVRAGTQIEMASNKVNLLSSEPSLIQSQNNPQHIRHMEGSEHKGSAMTLQKVLEQSNPNAKHQKAKSQHKFSQPALSSFNNSIDRIGPMNLNNQSSVSNVVAISNKDKRQNYSLNPQQQAHLKKTLTQTQNQVDAIFNSAYAVQNKPRKNMKAQQQLQKKIVTQIPNNLNQTQSLRFGQQNPMPNMANYSSNGPLTSSTNQSGMTSTTNPHAQLIINEHSQANLVNTATIPLIKNGEAQSFDSMGGVYANTQILDRLFNQSSTQSNQTSGSNKKRSAKGQNVLANSYAKGKNGVPLAPPSKDFMVPSTVTSAAAFYAASQPQNATHISNYQLQNINKQKLSSKQYNTNSTQPTELARLQPNPIGSSNIQHGTNQSGTGVISSKNKPSSSLSANEKGNKNNFYLKQQLNQNRGKQYSSKERAAISSGGNDEPSATAQHRKNHSVVLQRDEILGAGGEKQHLGQIVKVNSKAGQKQFINNHNIVLGVPGELSPERVNRIGGMSSQGLKGPMDPDQVGAGGPPDYVKGINQSAKNSTGQVLKKKPSGSSIVDRVKNGGAMTPSLEANNNVQGITKANSSSNYVRSSKQKPFEEQQYPGSNPNNMVAYSKQMMVQDGGTGASLKRVFIQQESAVSSQADSASNYGGGAHSYNLPIKASSGSGFKSNQQKRAAMQKANQNRLNSQSQKNRDPSNTAKQMSSKRTEDSAASDMLGDSVDLSSKINLSQHQAGLVNRPRPQQRLHSENIRNDDITSVGDYALLTTNTEKKPGSEHTYSINITQEALRIGKIPTEEVARNIAQGRYTKSGALKNAGNGAVASPRIQEMLALTGTIKKSFQKQDDAPETTTEFYRAGKMLGRGAFGKVNLGMHKLTRKLIAIKSINKEYLSEEKQRSKIMHEVGILLKLRHNSVVKLYETFETRRHIMLVMELCAGGDLLNFVRKRKKLDEPLAKVLFRQIIEGIGYIHSKKVLHRDIKLDNILLDGKGHVKIADFGVSKSVKKGELMFEQSGTPAYIAPEIIRDKGYKGFKADLWSAGVVLFALLFGTVPFKANNMKDLHQQILQAKYNMKEEISEQAKNLIRGLLQIDPRKRLSVSQVLKHEWLVGTEFLSQDIFNEAEKEVIRGEFTYNDPSRFNRNEKVKLDEEPWDCFTELNLDSMDCTLRNASEKSLILAPFNSTMSDVDQFFKEALAMAPMEDKKETIKFAARCRDQDRQYEINNNAELDNGVYHKFVYSTKDSKGAEADKKREEEALLSRNESRANLEGNTKKVEGSIEGSEDLTKARDPGKKAGGKASSIAAEREALKADIKRQIKGSKKASARSESSDDYTDEELQQSHASQLAVQLDDERVQTLVNLGYPPDYVKYSVLENEANYCLTGYYLLLIDQNY